MSDVIRGWVQYAPTRSAVGGKNKRDMSYGELAALMDHIARQLTHNGDSRSTRFAIVHRGGAEMATTLLCVMDCAIAVPLNPTLRATEFERYFDICGVNGLIVDEALDTPARSVARKMRLPVINVAPAPNSDTAGHIVLNLPSAMDNDRSAVACAEDAALVLTTSGTTSLPKVVPLRHRHILSRSHSTAVLHELTPQDRCLNLNQLFLQGGVANTYTALFAGGCTTFLDADDRYDVSAFLKGLSTLRPTWYIASYIFNIRVYELLSADPSALLDHTLRFIRTASGHIGPDVIAGLQRLFGVPVIEAYSSTESGRISGNPMPPRQRKHGTVGLPAVNSEVAILSSDGKPAPAGERGEVVVRGSNVFDGYENNPSANADAFVDGWYRTGDEGFFDTDGYLTLTGRIKEMINRGGMKISPTEIDQALTAFPYVREAAAFPIPHPTLGEIPGAAIVWRSGRSSSDREALLRFLRKRLAPFKVPVGFLILKTVPRGPGGKILRRRLTELFDTQRASRKATK